MGAVSGKKSAHIAALIAGRQGQRYDAHYLAFFDCFNLGLFYEAHDVLEELWLPERKGADGGFYKGLIQLAGAFVHLQKNRLQPSASLLKLAAANLQQYVPLHQDLDVTTVLRLIEDWLQELNAGDFQVNPLESNGRPELRLSGVFGGEAD
jgi:predicted metal-dependent hydrolase